MNLCICPKNTLIWPKIISLDWPQTSNSINLKNCSLNLFVCDKQHHVPLLKTTRSDSTWIKAYDHYQQDSKKNMNTAGGIHSTQLIQYTDRLKIRLHDDDGASWACWTKTLTYISIIGAPRVFSWRLKISIIWGIIKTEELKTQFFQDLKNWRHHYFAICDHRNLLFKTEDLKTTYILNLKIRNLVLCAGSPKIRDTQHFNKHYPHLFVVCPVPTTSSSPPPS